MQFHYHPPRPDAFDVGEETLLDLPIGPTSTIEFIKEFRPTIGRVIQDFDQYPFWVEPLEDNHPNIMWVNGRQTFKTTNCANLIAKYAIAYPGSELTYVADDEVHRSAFSEQRLRAECFLSNEKLKQYLPNGRANVGRIRLLNGSVCYLTTDENRYHQVEGKSNRVLILDETQAQTVESLPIALYSLSKTKGNVYLLGIGGEAGSEYWKLWERTDQREWVYDDPYWRERLLFDSRGNVSNTKDDLKAVLAGRWIARKPENVNYRGYQMPQTIFPNIPLTIQDAVTKYQTQPELSIEYQRKHYPLSVFLSHTMGDFYKAERRPITPEMVQACYVRYLTLLKPDEVRGIKETYGREVRILMGVDFGSGPVASQTVASIIIHWRKSGRYQLAWIDPRPQEHQLDQARYLATLGHSYGIDIGVGDLGYGQIQVKLIQDGGRDSQDQKYQGLGRGKFYGCRTIGDEVKPHMAFRQETDEHGTELARLQIDKTTAIQNFIDFIGSYVSHPTYPGIDEQRRTKFMIPVANDWETEMLQDDFCSITRKDLDIKPESVEPDPRQRARKEFNHPPDTVMSIIYCLVADTNYDDARYRIATISKK